MSIHKICDSCKKIIYDGKYDRGGCVLLEIQVTNRYHKLESENFSLHLCESCDMKVARALVKLLPNVAYRIEPNVNTKD